MSSGVLIFIYIVAIAVVLVLNGLLASNASDIANEKGYEKRKWFHMCFWLGFVPYIIIAAMPDRSLQAKQDKTNELLTKILEETAKKAAAPTQNRNNDISSYLPDL